jgi:hypothetical protein
MNGHRPAMAANSGKAEPASERPPERRRSLTTE